MWAETHPAAQLYLHHTLYFNKAAQPGRPCRGLWRLLGIQAFLLLQWRWLLLLLLLLLPMRDLVETLEA
jgi:hypothetical protein